MTKLSVKQVYQALNDRVPSSLSCEWDNDGMMCLPDPDRPAQRILVTLDVTDAALDHAIDQGFDLIVSHHPLLFNGIKHLTHEDGVARKCIRLCKHGIAVVSLHTRLDAVCGGVNDALSERLGLTDVTSFEGDGQPMGRIGNLADGPCDAATFAAFAAQRLHAPGVLLADAGRVVHRVAVLGGSGADFIRAAIAAGADTFLTGEVAHHHMIAAPEMGLNLIAAGHFYTEEPVCDRLVRLLQDIAPAATVEHFNSECIKTVFA